MNVCIVWTCWALKNDFMHILTFRSHFHSNLALAKYYNPNRVAQQLKYRYCMMFYESKAPSIYCVAWLSTNCHSGIDLFSFRKLLFPQMCDYIRSSASIYFRAIRNIFSHIDSVIRGEKFRSIALWTRISFWAKDRCATMRNRTFEIENKSNKESGFRLVLLNFLSNK